MKRRTTKIYSALKSIGLFKTMKSSINLPFIIKDWLCWKLLSFYDRRAGLAAVIATAVTMNVWAWGIGL